MEEVVVFGKGVGESILLHIKGDKWIVIDSFVDPVSKTPIALEYMKHKGVDTRKIIGMVCTHWDDDHIHGIADIIAQSERSLPFVLPISLTNERVKQYIADNTDKEIGKISEFQKVLKQRKQGKCELYWAQSDRILLGQETAGSNIVLKALSPNDKQYEAFLQSIVLAEANQEKKRQSSNENIVSIVIHVKTDSETFLLGGDLENSSIGGWRDICDSYYEISRSRIFKIPHHGSSTAYYEDVWKKIVEMPISIITRFNRSHLPKREMVQKIVNHSWRTFVIGPKPKKDKQLIRVINKSKASIKDIKSFECKCGYVRLYKTNHNSEWEEEVSGEVNVYHNGENVGDW